MDHFESYRPQISAIDRRHSLLRDAESVRCGSTRRKLAKTLAEWKENNNGKSRCYLLSYSCSPRGSARAAKNHRDINTNTTYGDSVITHIADGGDWKTTITIVNLSSTKAARRLLSTSTGTMERPKHVLGLASALTPMSQEPWLQLEKWSWKLLAQP